MVNVVIGNNLSRASVVVDEHSTLKSALIDANIDYSRGVTTLDGATLKPGDINKTFAEMGVTDSCSLLNVVKADNAAKISIKAGVCFVESSMKLADIQKLEKYSPKTLELKDAEGKNVVFKVGSSKGDGSINRYGVSFGANTTADGHAVVTMKVPEGTPDAKKWAMDAVGSAILDLGKVEKNAEAGLNAVANELKAIEETISLA